jgi:hypothetical protein
MKGVCTGCGWIVLPGPYFIRRCKRHLRLSHHNHDAIELQEQVTRKGRK